MTLIALNVGGEYDHGTLRNLLIRQPGRIRLFIGKTAYAIRAGLIEP